MRISKWIYPPTGEIRKYVNDWKEISGLEFEYYKSGSIRWAFLGGKKISNSKARKIDGKFWIDESGEIHADRFNGAGVITEQDVIEKIKENLK